VNKYNELMYVVPKYFVKCCNHRSMSQLDYKHLSPVTPPASTLGETSPSLQVFPKGSIVRVLLVHCRSVEPWVLPYDNTRKFMTTFSDFDLVGMDSTHLVK
jgi:hypothetical protein